jgi:hypothetical protein
MGLTMGQRRAVTRAIATRYRRADKPAKTVISDELCATTGWHRNQARKALTAALRPKIVRPRQPRTPRYGKDVVAALALCWAVLGAPSGKRLAPVMAELVPRLRHFDELDVSDLFAAFFNDSGDKRVDIDRQPGERSSCHSRRWQRAMAPHRDLLCAAARKPSLASRRRRAEWRGVTPR